ncbi:Fur family transcriptional regulator [Sulfurimonas sp.]|nr:Fur family transcriptional regulator [Sulfurimonas sp.]
MIDFTNELRIHNLKATPQRLAISDAMQTHGHINIDALYTIMLKKFNSISLATIYKNINLMLENSFIQEVKLPQNKSVYELTKEVHSHLVCQKCNKILDINLELQTILNEAQAQSDFKISKSNLVLSGICKKCQ